MGDLNWLLSDAHLYLRVENPQANDDQFLLRMKRQTGRTMPSPLDQIFIVPYSICVQQSIREERRNFELMRHQRINAYMCLTVRDHLLSDK